MKYSLAVYNYQLGSFSETFVKRHMDALMPGHTVLITDIGKDRYGGHWTVDAPSLNLEAMDSERLRYQVLRAARRKLKAGDMQPPETAAVKKFLKKFNVQVLLGEYLDKSFRWIPVAKELGIRFFGHAHGYDVSRTLRDSKWQQRYLLYNETDGVITMSESSRERLIRLGIKPDKIYVVPYGVDVPDCFRARSKNQVVRCLAVCRMTGKKAPILLLDAFRRAFKRYPNLHLDWVGEGELMPSAMQFVQAFHLAKHVTFHGGQLNEYAQKLMADADMFLQHSVTDPINGDEEGLPVAILEAMANGLPVLATRHAGIPEAVLDGVTGFLVEEGDSAAMADRLQELVCDYALRQEMGENGWRRIQSDYTWSLERERLLSILGLKESAFSSASVS